MGSGPDQRGPPGDGGAWVEEVFVLEQLEKWRRLVSLDDLDDPLNRIEDLPSAD